MNSSYIVAKTYHFTTSENQIVEVPVGTFFNFVVKRYTATVKQNDQIIILWLDQDLIETNPTYFTKCKDNEAHLFDIINSLQNFLIEHKQDKSLAEKAYQRILWVLNYKDELRELQDENAKLKSEIFILKLNNGKYDHPYQQPLNPSPWTQPLQPTLNWNNCYVCGIDMSKNTNYVCLNSLCPSRISYTSSTTTLNLGSNGSMPTATSISCLNLGTATSSIQI